MRTRSVFTAEVIKVVRAGLDKEQSRMGDVSRQSHIHGTGSINP